MFKPTSLAPETLEEVPTLEAVLPKWPFGVLIPTNCKLGD